MKDLGFITGKFQDICDSHIGIGYRYDQKRYVDPDPYDHEGSSISCDTSWYNKDEFSYVSFGVYEPHRHCVYGREIAEIGIDYYQ